MSIFHTEFNINCSNFSFLLPKMFCNALLETFIYWCVLDICITLQDNIVTKDLLADTSMVTVFYG